MSGKSKPAAAPAAINPTPTMTVCPTCATFANVAGNTTRDGHVYVNRATVAECNANVARDRAANDAARATRDAADNDAARAAANVAVKRTGDRVWRTRNPHGLGGTVSTPRAARPAAAPTVPANGFIVVVPDAMVATIDTMGARFAGIGMDSNAIRTMIADYAETMVASIDIPTMIRETVERKIAELNSMIA